LDSLTARTPVIVDLIRKAMRRIKKTKLTGRSMNMEKLPLESNRERRNDVSSIGERINAIRKAGKLKSSFLIT
jgi:hypothetical protein